jgi:glycosyltransferase involved in cell wall biosynthesis
VKTGSPQLKVEQMDEKEWALECASRILKRKHAAATRHVQRILTLESIVDDLNTRLNQKDKLLKKITDSSWEVIPINISRGPETIPAKVSVIIPVKDAGEQLGRLLAKIRSQRKVPDLEIIIQDSGSRDSSIAVAGEYGATIQQIPPHEFNHGATRNLGASVAKGDFLVFTVQDAMPSSDYWLYRMLSPFIQYPGLSALSARQIVKPEADLFSLWSSDGMSRLLNFDSDVIYRHSSGCKSIGLDHLDSLTKRRLTFFDNVSSCIRASVFREMRFAPLMNAEDIDFGVRLFTEEREIGYLTSAGVYHWHERGADHVFRRNYIGVKSSIYTMKNNLEYFFKLNSIGWENLICCMSGAYELINAAIFESEKIAADRPVDKIKAFLKTFQGFLDEPCKIPAAQLVAGDAASNMAPLIEQIFADTVIMPDQKYDFKKNFLISDFMGKFKDFANFLCNTRETLEGREQDFNDTVFKIFAQSAGDSLGTFFIEEETLGRLTPNLVALNHSLGKGICY